MSEVTPELITALTESISQLTTSSQEMKNAVGLINDRLQVVESRLSSMAEDSSFSALNPGVKAETGANAEEKRFGAATLKDPEHGSDFSSISAQIGSGKSPQALR